MAIARLGYYGFIAIVAVYSLLQDCGTGGKVEVGTMLRCT